MYPTVNVVGVVKAVNVAVLLSIRLVPKDPLFGRNPCTSQTPFVVLVLVQTNNLLPPADTLFNVVVSLYCIVKVPVELLKILKAKPDRKSTRLNSSHT